MTLPLLMIGSTWFIARYRGVGVIISLFLGWAILLTVYKCFPAPVGVWDEDGEDIHYIAPMLMIIWCFPVWAFVSVVSSLKKRGKSKQ